MKKGGGSVVNKGSGRPPKQSSDDFVYIHPRNLLWAQAELDILRNSRATTNVEFENVLGEYGLEFDRTFRILVPWFVHYDFSRSPIEIIQIIGDYFVQNRLCNEYTLSLYLTTQWKTERQTVINSTNLNTYVSSYRSGLWRLYKSFFLRPCHWDTNLALINYWGPERDDSTFFGEGEMLNFTSKQNHFGFDTIDKEMYDTVWQGDFCGFPSDWNSTSQTFDHSDGSHESNLFLNFLMDISNVTKNVTFVCQKMINTLNGKTDACVRYKASWETILKEISAWEANPIDIDSSYFDILHNGLATSQKMQTYVQTKNDKGEPLLSTESIAIHLRNANLVGRTFRDLITTLRRSHIWIFFGFGRSHKNDFWVVNPCGTWAHEPQSSADYKFSTGPDDWTSKVSWTSMGWFIKLGWLIINRKANSITLQSTYTEDMVAFLGQKPASAPIPHADVFADILKKNFDVAFGPTAADPLGWSKLVSVLYPFMSFPKGREKTTYKVEGLETQARVRQALPASGSSSCKILDINNIAYQSYFLIHILVMPKLGSSLTETERARLSAVLPSAADDDDEVAQDQDVQEEEYTVTTASPRKSGNVWLLSITIKNLIDTSYIYVFSEAKDS